MSSARTRMVLMLRAAMMLGACASGAVIAPAAHAEAQNEAQNGAHNGVAISEIVRDGYIDSTNLPHPGTKIRRGRAVALVDAPMAEVLRVVENYAGYKGFLPNFEKSQVLSQRGSSALVYVQVSILRGAAKIWAQLKLKEAKSDGATRVITGKMMKGNVKHFEARWEITPYTPERTLVAFELIVDPELPLPSSLITEEVQKSTRKTLRALRKVVRPLPAKQNG